jgi:hypothetical protein
MNEGFLYVLSNPQMPGLLKIGQSERHPAIRAQELSDHTGVPSTFRVVFYFDVMDRVVAEQRVHQALAERRVDPAREFFRVTESEAHSIVIAAVADLLSPRESASLNPIPGLPSCDACGSQLIRYSSLGVAICSGRSCGKQFPVVG